MKPKILLTTILLACTFVQVNAQNLNWNSVTYTAGTLSRNFGVIGNPGVTVTMNITGYTAGLPGGNPAKRIATPQAGTGTTCSQFCALRSAPTFSNPATQSLILTFTFSPAVSPLSFALYDVDGTGAVADSVRVTATGPSGAQIITMANVNPSTSNIFGSGTTTAIAKAGTGNNTDAQTNVSISGFVSTLVVTFMGQGSFSIGNMFWNTALPVKWVSFTGKKLNDGKANLNWVTENEENADSYKIEKSKDGIIYQGLGKKSAMGKDKNEYSYIDESMGAGNSFYRIKQVDIDGQFNYSTIVSIKNNEIVNEQFFVFPNPAISTITLSSSDNTQFKNIRILDAQGQLVHNYFYVSNKVDVSKLKTGIYYLRAENNLGVVLNKKFIKQ